MQECLTVFVSVGFCRESRVEGNMSRVEGKMSRVEGKMSRVKKYHVRLLSKSQNSYVVSASLNSLHFCKHLKN